MSEELLRNQIRQLITAKRSRDAAELLCAFLGGTTSIFYNPALDQLSRINRLEQGVSKYRINEVDADFELAQINQSILSIADKVLRQARGESIELNEEDGNETLQDKVKDNSSRNTLIIGAVLLLITAGLTYFTYQIGTPSVFQLRVKLIAPEGHEEMVRKGKVKLILDDEYRRKPLALNQQNDTVFANIPTAFLDSEVRLLPVDMRYKVVSQTSEGSRQEKSMSFELARLPDTCIVRGTIFDVQGQQVPYAWITAANGKAYGFSDKFGRFQIAVPGKVNEQANLLIEVKGRRHYDGNIPLPESDPIILNLYRDTIVVSKVKLPSSGI